MTTIARKYSQLGGHSGFLGQPSTTESVCPDTIGHYTHFEGGSIYWNPGLGAFEVHGAIRDKWASLGWEKGFLGYPTTDECITPDGVGRYNHFQGGSIYWHPNLGAFEVHGAIRDKWANVGWERSFLGYPATDECTTPDGVGRYNHFQRGSIYWHPNLGAFEVHGAIRDKWANLGWEKSFIGYPKSDEKIELEGICRCSYFQRGYIYFHPDAGAFAMGDESLMQPQTPFGGSWDPNYGCQWPGAWRCSWTSPTGWYHGNMAVEFGTGKARLQHDLPTGDYSTLLGTGSLVTDQFGNSVAYRWTGEWNREKGTSGGSVPYGQYILDLSYDNYSNTCTFVGFWTYGNDNPLYSKNRYIWQGN